MISSRLGKSQTVRLFVTVSFPIHFWAILVFLLSAPNVDHPKAIGDALGVASYILLFSLFESMVIFLGFLFLSFLLPQRWGSKKIFSVLLSFFLLLVFWALVGNFLPLLMDPYGVFARYVGLDFLDLSPNSQTVIVLLLGVFVVSSPIIALQLGKNEKFGEILLSISEKIEPITYLYLFIDGLAIVYVLARNIL